MFTKCVEKTKRKLQKYILKLIDRKKKKLKNDDDEFIYFFYKNSFNDLNNIKNLNFEYESKYYQKNRNFFVNKRKRIRDKYKRKEC